MKKTASIYEPTADEREDFNYYWQHLRRNSNYVVASADIRWNTDAFHCADSLRRKGKIQHSLHHQWREFEACCLLPIPVSAGVVNSHEALREVLKEKPDFFQTPQWQTMRAKASAVEPAAFWNFAGPHSSAWRDYYDSEKYMNEFWKDPRQDYYERFAFWKDPNHPERHDIGREFMHLQVNLEIKEQGAGNLKRIEHDAKQHGRTVEAERKLKQAEYAEALARMKKFLEAHPRMDFVADTRLPWATVSRALESEWNRIKDLRRCVGLQANEQPPRKREWKKQLEVYDAYLPHWLENRKKIAALPCIWRENLGFQEAFKLMEVELTPEAANLAKQMDKQGLKPKGVFKFADRILRSIARDSYANSLPSEFSFENGRPVPITDFDHEVVSAALDGVDVKIEPPGSVTGEEARKILQSWRPHFSIPKHKLRPRLSGMSADKRREWFVVARHRIEALWPSGRLRAAYLAPMEIAGQLVTPCLSRLNLQN
jgi:hypothetical protein